MTECAGLSFETIPPPASLIGVVDHFWMFRGRAPTGSLVQHITPMRYGEIVLHFGDTYQRRTDDGWTREPRFGVFGAVPWTVQVKPQGWVDVLTARLTPLGLHRLSGIPGGELMGRALAVEELSAGWHAASWRTLASAEPADRLRLFIQILERQVGATPSPLDRRMEWVVSSMERRPDGSAGRLAASTGLSLRQLENCFDRWIGLSPRQYRGTARIERAVSLLVRDRSQSLCRLAHELDYHDQAHFSRDFRQRIGMSPSEFVARHVGAFFLAADGTGVTSGESRVARADSRRPSKP